MSVERLLDYGVLGLMLAWAILRVDKRLEEILTILKGKG